MINTTIEQVKARKYFYREYYRKGLTILIVLLSLEVFIMMGAYFVFKSQYVPAYYATSSDGILTPLQPRPEPNRSNTALLE